MNSLVSVVLPTFNAAGFLRQTIDSILHQAIENIDVIVVDDGSSDQTVEIARSYGKKVSVIAQANQGVCAARNAGLAEAKGKYICFLDHDDYWYPNKLKNQLLQFQKDPELGVVYSEFLRWPANADGEFQVPDSLPLFAESDAIDQGYSGWIYHLLLSDCWVLTSSAMIKVEALAKVGAFDLKLPYSEDWDLWLRLSQQYRFTKLSYPYVLYRQHVEQGSRTVRPIDYRTKLLSEASRRWGLSSKDGRCISRSDFKEQMYKYHCSYGFSRLSSNQRLKAMESFISAWQYKPGNLKAFAYILLGLAGWKSN